MKKALIVTSVASMVDQFLMPSVRLLQKMDYEVHVACNFVKGSTCSDERIAQLKENLTEYGVPCVQIDFARDVMNFSENALAYKQIKELLGSDSYDIIHCHSPIGGLITRFAARKARKKGAKVFYTAHGFHFYKGAPLKNWLMYYPVEKVCSCFTDVLITINQEDYVLAQKKMKAKKVEYIPGVGINLSEFSNVAISKCAKREEIGVPYDAKLLFSVGELNDNKNHQIIIKALARIGDSSIHYAIAGIGDKKEALLELAKELGVTDQVHLLGYRKDISELNCAADIFCFPSKREGLGLAAIEAMACGLPLITSNMHGINDYSIEGVTGYKCSPDDVEGFAKAITKLVHDGENNSQIREHNSKAVEKYSVETINALMKKIYYND